MKSKSLISALGTISLLLLVSGAGVLAQDQRPVHFSGLINDYSPSTVKGGPWEMHGQWTLDIKGEFADFAADMTMSDYGTTPSGAVDTSQGGVNPHTHHIRLTHVKIIGDIIGCPVYAAPVPTTGFQFGNTVSLLTGNGSIAPFETNPPSSVLHVCVLGGSPGTYSIPNSNITMVFTGPATMHFGTQAIHGVVRSAKDEAGNETVTNDR